MLDKTLNKIESAICLLDETEDEETTIRFSKKELLEILRDHITGKGGNK